MERDMYENQRKISGMLKGSKMEIKDTTQTSKIKQMNGRYVSETHTKRKRKNILEQLKNRKTPGPDKIRKEQQGFRKNRSTIDTIFIVRQITEKSLELNTPAFLCFLDMIRVFDRARLADTTQIMGGREISPKLMKVRHDINSLSRTMIKLGNELTEEIQIRIGIRQGDSVSPFVFNMIMDKIIGELPKTASYKVDNTYFNAVCYAYDAVLIADSEDNLLLYSFN
ncbi:hypothetical protein Trydic_g21170 [Trypoxylus dichotomus]